MHLLDPVSPFLALIDRIITRVQARSTRRRDYFEKIVEPLYEKFIPLGEDYLKLFQEAEEAIRHPEKGKRSAAASAIKRRRDIFSAARTQLYALLAVCEKNARKKKNDELVAFIGDMVSFFDPMIERPISEGGDERPWSGGSELVKRFDHWGQTRIAGLILKGMFEEQRPAQKFIGPRFPNGTWS